MKYQKLKSKMTNKNVKLSLHPTLETKKICAICVICCYFVFFIDF